MEGQPRIFFGPIASGNILLNDPGWRDRLRDQYGVRAVEMDGSGIADATWEAGVGYLVVRGICDLLRPEQERRLACVRRGGGGGLCAGGAGEDGERRGGRGEGAGWGEKKGEGAGQGSDGPAPNNLRVRNSYFRGREEELSRLDKTLRQDRQATVTQASVFGLGGVGKSALALEYAHRALERGAYPGGIWWVAAEGDPVDALVRLAPTLRAHAPEEVTRRLPPGETKAEAIAEEVRVALQGERAPSLLVLDNVSAAGWGKYVPAGAVRVLATTRGRGMKGARWGGHGGWRCCRRSRRSRWQRQSQGRRATRLRVRRASAWW